jgi:hypothetical protein
MTDNQTPPSQMLDVLVSAASNPKNPGKRPYRNEHAQLALGLKAWELKADKAMSLRAIGQELGISKETVRHYLEQVIDHVTETHGSAIRKTQLAQSDELLAVWLPKALDGDYKAMTAVLKIWQQQALLTGANKQQPEAPPEQPAQGLSAEEIRAVFKQMQDEQLPSDIQDAEVVDDSS